MDDAPDPLPAGPAAPAAASHPGGRLSAVRAGAGAVLRQPHVPGGLRLLLAASAGVQGSRLSAHRAGLAEGRGILPIHGAH